MSDWQGLEEDILELMGDIRFSYGFDSGATGGSNSVRISKIPDYTKITDDISTSEIATWPGRRDEAEAKRKRLKRDKQDAWRRSKGVPSKRACQLSVEVVTRIKEHPGVLTEVAKELGVSVGSVHRWRQRLALAGGDVALARATPYTHGKGR